MTKNSSPSRAEQGALTSKRTEREECRKTRQKNISDHPVLDLRTSGDCRELVAAWTATSTTMKELQLRHLHGFLQSLNRATCRFQQRAWQARPAQQGQRPTGVLQLRSLYVFLNRQDHKDLPLRHERKSTTSDGLQLRHQHGILHCLTISLSLRNTGTTTLSKNCTRTEKNTVSTLSLLHYRNVHHSVEELSLRHEELEELPELVAEDHRDAPQRG